MIKNMISVEVIYIDEQLTPTHLALSLVLSVNKTDKTDKIKHPTVQQAILQSKILNIVPELNECIHDLNKLENRVGIFGRLVSLESLVEDGDRIEIYRILKKDPKLARRERAKREKAQEKLREMAQKRAKKALKTQKGRKFARPSGDQLL